MKTLKDVYIKVTKQNIKQLHSMVFYILEIGNIISFNYDDDESFSLRKDVIEYKQKVSLSELKRLTDTIPTRGEITRLKRQISAYKTNLSLTNERCKEFQSDNESVSNYVYSLKEEIKKGYEKRYNLNTEIESLKKENDEITKMYDDLVLESGKKQNLLQNLYDDALKENDDLKLSNEKSLKKIYDLEKKLKHVVDKNELQGDLIEEKNFKISDLEKIKEDFADVIIYRNKEIAKLSEELERLKNKKWWQIWK